MQILHSKSALLLALVCGFGVAANTAVAAPQDASGDAQSSSAGQAVSDAWITTKVKSELADTKGVKSMDITVRTTNGVVTLTGVLATKTDVRKAIAAARSVKGVTGVDASGLKAKD